MRWPLREMIAVPRPRTGAKELLPMRTRRFQIAFYKMKAEQSGTMWSVAPVSATTSRRPSTNASGETARSNADTSPGGRIISSGKWPTADRDEGSDSSDTQEQDGKDELGDGREEPTGGYMETDPLGLKSAPSSSPSQQKLSVELSSPASTVAESPAGAEPDPEAESGGGMTAAGAAAGGVVGGTLPRVPAEGVEPEEDPRVPPLTLMSLSPSSPRSGHFVGWCFSFPLQKAQ